VEYIAMTIKLLIADDHEVVRTGLGSLVADTEIEVVGGAASGAEALELAKQLQPDVILLDIRMPDGNGLSVLKDLQRDLQSPRVIMLTTYDNPTYIAQAVAAGAKGYLLKGSSREELLAAIRTVAGGNDAWKQEDLRRVMGAMVTPRIKADLDVPLTEREAQVLRQIACGLTNKEIAKSLHISVETVKEHVQHILRKVGVSDRTQAAVWAVRKGLV
jgi:DNA-binding NarL/FixJ family response regulator